MPYITREDGERFVIPSYRDTLRARSASILKREIQLLSSNYGEYITLQKKAADRYEAAFSTDTGYLLGESIWNFFKRPADMIYCEQVPNTTEAILVIVKSGTVYLDGMFAIDSIPEELVIFKTQSNHFQIFTFGDVPISEHPEDEKFSFDVGSVELFSQLDSPVFATLPLYKNYHLEIVDIVLKNQGIGVFPAKQLLGVVVIFGLIWMGWQFLEAHKHELPIVVSAPVDPYLEYRNVLTSSDPVDLLLRFESLSRLLQQIPGWEPQSIEYSAGLVKVFMLSTDATTDLLMKWADQHHATVDLTPEGFYLNLNLVAQVRKRPQGINRLQSVMATLIDRMAVVMRGNHVSMGPIESKKTYSQTTVTISFSVSPPITLALIAEQLRGLPLILNTVSLRVTSKGLTSYTESGTIVLTAVGN